MNAIELMFPIRPASPSTFALLEDSFLKGSFRVVDTYDELNHLDQTTLKLGMLISVTEHEGKIYEVVEINEYQDEYGDTYATPKFAPFYAKPNFPKYERPQKTIIFSDMTLGTTVNKKVNMGCKSFILAGLTIGNGRKMKLKIHNNLLLNEDLPFEFTSHKRSEYEGITYLKNKTKFQYKQYRIFINTNSYGVVDIDGDLIDSQHVFTFSCESLEDSTFYISKGFYGVEIPIEISYIPLEG